MYKVCSEERKRAFVMTLLCEFAPENVKQGLRRAK